MVLIFNEPFFDKILQRTHYTHRGHATEICEFFSGKVQFKFFEVVEAIGQGMDISYISKGLRDHLDFSERGRLLVNDYFQSKRELPTLL